jgi:transcriptional regulator with XRE-family HTH domain
MKRKTQLATLREFQDVTQFQIAKEMGISQAQYCQLETGWRRSENFDRDAREALARVIRKKLYR